MWICPTLGRPERLRELADSWERFESGKRLIVRLYEGDPRLDEYKRADYPEDWEFVITGTLGAGETLNYFYSTFPLDRTFGFIADDVVLETPGGLKILEEAAFPWFVSYPNDCLQRHRLPTHFCVGRDLAREMGGIVPPMFRHSYMDVGILNIAQPMVLLRYCPQVIFRHRHFINGEAEKDTTYEMVFPDGSPVQAGEYEEEGQEALARFQNGYLVDTLRKIQGKFMQYEQPPE